METLINQIHALERRCIECAYLMKEKYASNDPRVECFVMIHNEATVTSETFDYYVRLFQEQGDQLPSRIRGLTPLEHLEHKCYIATKALFILAVSKIEFNMKKTIRLYPDHKLTKYVDRKEKLLDSFNRVYSELGKETQRKLQGFRQELRDVPPYDTLGRIIEGSRKISLIDENAEKIWKFIIFIRNCTVHDNSISSRDYRINIDGQEFQFREAQMMEGKVDFYLFLTRKATEHFFSWGQQIDQSE